MATDNEPAKLLLPYLQRADELQKHEPLVAYYCRLYAMERGLKIPQSDRTKTTNALLVSLMKQLEKDKMSVKLGADDHLHVERFASNVFARADKQDRAGQADLNTAKTFYAASIFFEILNQFGELQPDLDQKQKYAAWKAADIRKALKEGRKPLPGPPGGDKDLSGPSSSSSGEYELEPSRTDIANPASRTTLDSDSSFQAQDQDNFQPSPKLARQSSYSPPSTNNCSEHSIYRQSYQHDVPSSYSYPNFQSYSSNVRNGSVSEVSPHEYDSSYQPPPEKIAEAHKAARFAVGALAFDDVSVAVDYLKKSLELLTNQSSG